MAVQARAERRRRYDCLIGSPGTDSVSQPFSLAPRGSVQQVIWAIRFGVTPYTILNVRLCRIGFCSLLSAYLRHSTARRQKDRPALCYIRNQPTPYICFSPIMPMNPRSREGGQRTEVGHMMVRVQPRRLLERQRKRPVASFSDLSSWKKSVVRIPSSTPTGLPCSLRKSISFRHSKSLILDQKAMIGPTQNGDRMCEYLFR